MLQIFPIIIISSTIPLSEPIVFYPEHDYSVEAQEFMNKNKVKDSQDTSNILYDLILEELLKNSD
jgi:hypothetical protein